MTWKEFKEEAERMGMKDDDEVWFIDIHGLDGNFKVEEDPALGWQIWSW